MAFVADVSARTQLEAERVQLLQAATSAAQQRAAALAQLHTIVHSAPIGIGFFDTELRFQLINAHLARINGQPAAAHLGRTLDEILPELAVQLAPVMREVLRSGEPRIDMEVLGGAQPEAEE